MFSRDALLLIGHGSTSVPDAARPLLTHADAIRETNRFGEVENRHVFFWANRTRRP